LSSGQEALGKLLQPKPEPNADEPIPSPKRA
jgi:hypothetical protein